MYPFIQITKDIIIPNYFLVISLTFVICSYWIVVRAPKFNLEPKMAIDLSLIIMVSGFIGGRLFHVFYENPDIYMQDPAQILKFWQGGFVFYGGAIFAFISVYLYLKFKGQSIMDWLNPFAPIICFGYLCGRFATLLSGSGFGRPTDLPWGITYPVGPEAPANVSLHPTPIYSMLWQAGALILILLIERNKNHFLNQKGKLFFFYLALHSIGRLVIEQFRADFRGSQILGLSVSSWISVSIFLLAVYLVSRPVNKIKL